MPSGSQRESTEREPLETRLLWTLARSTCYKKGRCAGAVDGSFFLPWAGYPAQYVAS